MKTLVYTAVGDFGGPTLVSKHFGTQRCDSDLVIANKKILFCLYHHYKLVVHITEDDRTSADKFCSIADKRAETKIDATTAELLLNICNKCLLRHSIWYLSLTSFQIALYPLRLSDVLSSFFITVFTVSISVSGRLFLNPNFFSLNLSHVMLHFTPCT